MSKRNPNDTMKVLVSIPVPKGYSSRDVVDYVRDAVHAHAGGFVDDSMIGESRKATARACTEKLAAELALTSPEAAAVPTLTPVQVLTTLVREMNAVAHVPPASLRQNRREYWKAGARACLQALNSALHASAHQLLGVGRPQPMDSELFSYWVEEASRRPYRIAGALSHCKTPDDYRVALWRLVKEDEGKALTSPELLNPEGGLV